MKKILLILILLISKGIYAQDLIVTKTNDSVNCKVVSQQGSFTLYKVLTANGPQSRAISNKDVVKIEYNFYSSIPVQNPYNPRQAIAVKTPNETSFNFGLGYTNLFKLFDVDDPDFVDYYKDLSNAVSFHAEIQTSLKNKFGLSLRYDYYKSTAEKNNYPFVYQSQTYYFDLKDEVSIHTFSPGLYYKYPIKNNKENIKLFTSYDYNFFDNSSEINTTSYDLYGSKSGFSLGLGYEYFILKDIGLSLQLKYRACKLNKVTSVVGGGSGTEFELFGFDRININRLTIGLNVSLK